MLLDKNKSIPKSLAPLCVALALALATAARADVPNRYRLADVKALQRAFVELAESVQPSVVSIRTYRTIDPGLSERALVKVPLSQGSGFVIGDGFIATNFHVVQGADLITIRLSDGRTFPAVIQQGDPRSDLAVLRTEAEHLRVTQWGELDSVRVNQWAFACGNPFGLANDDGVASVSYGVVSALGRQMTRRLVGDSEVEYYGNLIETTASINPGNSGGPLFDIDGKVIGIVTAIETATGVSEGRGFAIPIDKNTRRILETLKAGKEVHYGFLGIQVEEVEQPMSNRTVSARPFAGARITAIRVPGGPAARAGLRAGDLVIEFDGVPVRDPDHLVRLVMFTPVGADSVVTYIRSGVKRRAHLTIGDRTDLLNPNNDSDDD